MPAPTAVRTDLAAHAKAAGFDHVFTVHTLEEFEKTLGQALDEEAPCYIVAKVEPTAMPGITTKQVGTVEEAINFRRALVSRNWVSAARLLGVSQGKWLAPEARASPLTIPDVKIERELGPRPSLEKARIIYSSSSQVRYTGIDLVAYVPATAPITLFNVSQGKMTASSV